MKTETFPRHIIRAVVDTLQECNLRCMYCHPGRTWQTQDLPAESVEAVLQTAEEMELLELTLTGGEITLHPELERILRATHIVDNTVVTLITNGTTLTEQTVRLIRDSNIARVCTSIDGPGPDAHNIGRGASFDKAMGGLRLLQETGKPITVISVAHHQNYQQILELSDLLAETGLASQHHICAPSYSGQARKNYDQFRLREDEFDHLQHSIDFKLEDLREQGLFVTFNSFWPATGRRAKTNRSRTMTLVQLTEQLKDCYVIVRPNGDVRLTSAAWGRETVGNAIIGNLLVDGAGLAFKNAEEAYANGEVRQLPRHIEATHKFHFGADSNPQQTDQIIDDKEKGRDLVEMVPITKLSTFDLFAVELTDAELKRLAFLILQRPNGFRLINIAGNSYILFDKQTTHVTLLTPEEALVLGQLVAAE